MKRKMKTRKCHVVVVEHGDRMIVAYDFVILITAVVVCEFVTDLGVTQCWVSYLHRHQRTFADPVVEHHLRSLSATWQLRSVDSLLDDT